MKIICAGAWKTGTKSLAEALRILGYRVYDYDEQIMVFSDLWLRLIDGTVTDEEIRKTFENIDVLIDGPIIPYFYEVFKQFPEAKVILTTRHTDAWYKSFKAMRKLEPRFMFLLWKMVSLLPATRNFCLITTHIWPYFFGEITFSGNERLYKMKYEMHNEFVRSKVPPERFLEFQSHDGWGPICKFLGVKEHPELPFPYKNKNNALLKTFSGDESPSAATSLKKMMYRAIFEFVIFVILILTALYMVCKLCF